MKFLKLCIENYKCFQKPIEINLDIIEGQKNIVLIGGMNGAGKTAILEAINICLYGESKAKIFHGINRSELEKGNGNIFFELQISFLNQIPLFYPCLLFYHFFDFLFCLFEKSLCGFSFQMGIEYFI